jgi:hypothetical protein
VAPGQVGGIYAIPTEHWTAISNRVGLALLIGDGPVGQVLAPTADFPDFLAACHRWRDTTFPGLVAGARALVAGATGIADALRPIAEGLDAAAAAAPTDGAAPLLQDAGAAFHGSQVLAAQAAQAMSGLDAEVVRFVAANQAVDRSIVDLSAQLGPLWQPIGAAVGAVETAMGIVSAHWAAIISDLGELADPGTGLDLSALLALDLQAAVTAWTRVAGEAAGFVDDAPSQQALIEPPEE